MAKKKSTTKKASKRTTRKSGSSTTKKTAAKKSTRKSSTKKAAKKSDKKQAVEITFEMIRDRAEQIWHDKGCPQGQDDQNWLEAEAQLKAELG